MEKFTQGLSVIQNSLQIFAFYRRTKLSEVWDEILKYLIEKYASRTVETPTLHALINSQNAKTVYADDKGFDEEKRLKRENVTLSLTQWVRFALRFMFTP